MENFVDLLQSAADHLASAELALNQATPDLTKCAELVGKYHKISQQLRERKTVLLTALAEIVFRIGSPRYFLNIGGYYVRIVGPNKIEVSDIRIPSTYTPQTYVYSPEEYSICGRREGYEKWDCAVRSQFLSLCRKMIETIQTFFQKLPGELDRESENIRTITAEVQALQQLTTK